MINITANTLLAILDTNDTLVRGALIKLGWTPPGPIDMVLHCPACGLQHIDAPESINAGPDERGRRTPTVVTWANPPHRSHQCAGCGYIWRPADVPTNGVAAIKTHGEKDSPPVDSWRRVVAMAYAHLWHVQEDPSAPVKMRPAREAANAARRMLRDIVSKDEAQRAIEAVELMLWPNGRFK